MESLHGFFCKITKKRGNPQYHKTTNCKKTCILVKYFVLLQVESGISGFNRRIDNLFTANQFKFRTRQTRVPALTINFLKGPHPGLSEAIIKHYGYLI